MSRRAGSCPASSRRALRARALGSADDGLGAAPRRGGRFARRAAVAFAFALGASLAACGAHGAVGPNGVSRDDAIITITSSVPDATLWVDGRYIGMIGSLRHGIAIVAGTHRLELRHDDFFSRYAEVTVAAREHRALALDLAPHLP